MIQKDSKYKRQRILKRVEARPEEEKPKKSRLSETVVLAGVPILAYLLMYFYESGYLEFFGIPSQYISFEWAEIFIVVTTLSFIGFFVLSIADTAWKIFWGTFKKWTIVKGILGTFLLILLVVLSGFYQLLMGEYKLAYFLLAGGGILVLLNLILPFFYWDRSQSYIQNLGNTFERKHHTDTSKNETEKRSLMSIVFDIGGVYLSAYFLIFLISIIFVNPIGKSSAALKMRFFVINNDPECAVIYTKSNILICTPFDREKREFIPGYRIYSNEDLKDVDIVYEVLGPLQRKPTPTPTLKPTLTPTITKTPPPTATPTSTAEIPRFKD